MNISYGRQEITEEDIKAVVAILKSDFLTQGPAVDLFEAKLAEVSRAKHVLAVNNGTSALHLAALALDVKPDDWVLVATNTFIASANCIRYCGGNVEFVDIDSENFCISVDDLKRRLANKSKNYVGIVAVDLAGYPVDLAAIREIANEHRLWIIEDACHALGAYRENQGVREYSGGNSLADISIFSFHPVKHIATGEGGAVTTSRKDLYDKMKILRTHGITRDVSSYTHQRKSDGSWYHEMQMLGHNFRISDILCALGTSQLQRFSGNISARQKIADKYNKDLAGLPLQLPKVEKNIQHAYHLYIVRTDRRHELFDFLKTKNIHCQIHYIPVHTQPYYQKLYAQNDCPNAEKYYSGCLSLPMYHSMTSKQQDYVINMVKEFFVAK